MKATNRLLSGLLALVMVLSLCPVITFAEEVTPVNVGTLGKAAQQAGLAGKDEAGSNVWYLSDLYNKKVKESNDENVTLDTNYNNNLYAFNGAGARRQISAKLTDGYRQLENGVYYTKSEIALGYLGTKYEKGLGVLPAPEGETDRFIVYSTSSLNVDRFYAVVGGTGGTVTNPSVSTTYVTFEVYGAVAEGYTSEAEMTWTKLAYVDNIRSYLIAEFNVDITGYDYIKLVTKMSEQTEYVDVEGSAINDGAEVAWGDACFYSSTGAADAQLFAGLGKAPQQSGLAGINESAKNINYLSDLMSDKTYYVEHLGTNVVNANYNSDLFAFSTGSRKQISAKLTEEGTRTLDNGVTYLPTDIALGWNGIKYTNGIGVHPNSIGNADRYMTFDVSSLGAERFYAVVGATGGNITNPDTTDRKVTFEVWGGMYNSPSSFTKLAYADSIRAYVVSEIDVDISGYDYIKLVVKMSDGSVDNSSCAVAWGNALVYNDGYGATKGFTSYAEGEYNYAGYHKCAQVVKVADASKVMDSYVMPKSGSTDPRAVGVNVVFNNASLDYVNIGNPNVKYDASEGASFLNLHLSGSTQTDTYVTLDVTGLGDRFYSLVGINGNAKAATDVGAIFRIFGSKAETYDVEAYELLATSGSIYGYATGEFDIDIAGYNFLKLEVIRPEGQTSNSSGAVTWMEPAVYSNTLEHSPVIDEAVAPDCENTGLTEGSHCEVCGTVIVAQEIVPANGHDWGEGEITTAPGCETEGVKTFTCHCGETKTEPVSAAGHTIVTDAAVAPDCENTGLTEGSHCEVCGTVIVAQEIVPANGHDWGEGEITTAPGCETEGVKTFTCHCGETKTEPVSAAGHTIVTDAAVAPDCENTGLTEGSHCEVCGTVIVAQEIVPANDHTVVVDPYKAPSFTEAGLTEGSHCDVCGEVLVAQEEIPQLVAVAKIDENLYETLAEAVAAANDGDVIELLSSVSGSGIVIDKSITIDFGGNTYTVVGKKGDGLVGSAGTETLGFQILAGHVVTLTNGTLATGTDDCKMLVQNYSDLTLDDMIVDGTGSANMQYVLSNNSGDVNIKDTTISAPEGAVAFDVYNYTSAGYAAPSVEVNGTSVINGTVEVDSDVALNINEGTFNGEITAVSADSVSVSGGTFAQQIPEEWFDENTGLNTEPNSDGTYGVHTHVAGTPVVENEVAATCGTDGSYDSVISCTVCGKELSRETVTVPATGEHTWGEGVITTPATIYAPGVMTYTCECGETKTEDIEKATFTSTLPSTTYQVGLIEPWFLQINSMPCKPGTKDRYTADVLLDYGAFAIRASELADGLDPATLTAEQLMSQENAVHFSKEAGNITVGEDGRLSFRFNEGLYTYRLHEEILFVVYAQTADGWVVTEVRCKNLKDLMETNISKGTFPELEVDVYNKMLALYENVIAYRTLFEEQKEGVPQDTATLATTDIQFGAAATDGMYEIGNSTALYLIEPWGVKFLGRAANGSARTTADYSVFADYGVLVYHDKAGTLESAPSSLLDVTDTENVYVFSESQGTMSVDLDDTTRMTATYNKDIFTYQLDSNMYFMYFVQDGENFYYSRVFTLNIKDQATTNSSNTSLGEEERNVYPAMVGLYNSITAYRDDYFTNNPEEA